MQYGSKLRAGAGALIGALSVAVVLAAAVPAGAATTHGVSIVGLSFSPKTLTVAPGDTVVWTNDSGLTHTVTADDGSFDSGFLGPGQSFSHTFPTAGTVAYHCSIHGAPGGVGMSGTVVVGAAPPPPTTAPPVTTPATAPPTTVPAGPGVPSASPTTAPPSGAAPVTTAAGATAATDPAQLPHTGSNSAALAALAAVLLVLGAAAVTSARRRRA